MNSDFEVLVWVRIKDNTTRKLIQPDRTIDTPYLPRKGEKLWIDGHMVVVYDIIHHVDDRMVRVEAYKR